jgi:hypothetical protein
MDGSVASDANFLSGGAGVRWDTCAAWRDPAQGQEKVHYAAFGGGEKSLMARRSVDCGNRSPRRPLGYQASGSRSKPKRSLSGVSGCLSVADGQGNALKSPPKIGEKIVE